MILDREDWLGLVAFTFIQFIGSYVPVDRKQYAEGSKIVPGSPPGWIFGPVWIILKLLRGFAGFFYWHEGPSSLGATYDWALAIYAVNILLDLQWMPLFFGVKRSGAALIVLVLMWVTCLATLILFIVDYEWLSFGLYLPYLIWLSYAGYLNYMWWSKMVWEALTGMPMPASTKTDMAPSVSSVGSAISPNLKRKTHKNRDRTGAKLTEPRKKK